MIIKQMLQDAPMFTAFKGPAKSRLTDKQWDLFGIDGGTVATDEVLEEAAKRGIRVSICALSGHFVEPEFDDQAREDVPDGTDHDAILAYLADGGMVAKLPDRTGSTYCRYYTIMQAKDWYKPNHKKYGCQCDADPIHPISGGIPCPVHS